MSRELLKQSAQTIKSLRARNQILEAQVGVIEVFAAALGMRQGSGMMQPDIVWEIEQELAKPIKAGEVGEVIHG
jgi:hypothetical protein